MQPTSNPDLLLQLVKMPMALVNTKTICFAICRLSIWNGLNEKDSQKAKW